MGRLTIKVPDVGEGVAEVELVSWAVTEGQAVERNQTIAEVMTDKATVEVPAPVDGVVQGLSGAAGDVLLVGSTLFTLEVEGEGDTEIAAEPKVAAEAAIPTGAEISAEAALPEAEAVTAAGAGAAAPARGGTGAAASTEAIPAPAAARPVTPGPVAPRPEGRRPIATPAVRRRAREAGIDLRTVVGTGPAGRISHEDLDAVFDAARTGARPAAAGVGSAAGRRQPDPTVADQPIIGIRRKIAEQMVASTSTIPHITYVEEIDMTALEELRAALNTASTEGTMRTGGDGGRPRLTVLPFLIRALVNELPRFPNMNAHVIDPSTNGGEGGGRSGEPGTLRTFGGVHVGIATQTDGGLVVPVVHHAEAESLWSTATRIGELAEAARTGTAGPADLTGSTITITSLGPLGGLVTTPVINKPETTIVGVNKMTVRPVWIDGEFVPRKMMNLSCSFDHRVIDGWDAARFVQALKRSLEQPALLFIDQ